MDKTIFSITWRKILWRFCAIAVFATGLFYAGIMLYAPASYADDRETLKSVQQDIASKERVVRRQQQQRGKLLAQLKEQEQSIAAVSLSLHHTETSLATLKRQITDLNASISKLARQQVSEKRELAAQLDAAFRLGRQGAVQSLFMGKDSLRQQRIQVYYGYINQARQQTLNRLQQTQQQLAARKRQSEERQSSQQRLLAQQRSQQAKLAQVRDERKKTLTQLESSIQQGQQQLAELRQNEARLQESIARAQAAARQQAEREAREAQQVRQRQQNAQRTGGSYTPGEKEKELMARTGGLGRPQGQDYWPVQGALLHRYGDVIQGELRWKGIVIGVPSGTKVQAIADGRVILVDWLQGYGQVIVLEHGKGDMSLYGYNQSALVKVGETVRGGQPIALAGDSGGQGQSALYFEIRRQGQAVNPLPWLKK